jgi:hypothetical protein
MNPEVFIAFRQELKEYTDVLSQQKCSEMEKNILYSVNLLVSTIETDYRHTLNIIDALTFHQEITFEYLYAILVPQTLFVTRCAITGQPRLFKLRSAQKSSVDGVPSYILECESIDLVDRIVGKAITVGRVLHSILLKHFKGTIKMEELDAYPLKYHSDPGRLKKSILERGRKWASLAGVHHKQFDGMAAFRRPTEGGYGPEKLVRHAVNSRVIVDRGQECFLILTAICSCLRQMLI